MSLFPPDDEPYVPEPEPDDGQIQSMIEHLQAQLGPPWPTSGPQGTVLQKLLDAPDRFHPPSTLLEGQKGRDQVGVHVQRLRGLGYEIVTPKEARARGLQDVPEDATGYRIVLPPPAQEAPPIRRGFGPQIRLTAVRRGEDTSDESRRSGRRCQVVQPSMLPADLSESGEDDTLGELM